MLTNLLAGPHGEDILNDPEVTDLLITLQDFGNIDDQKVLIRIREEAKLGLAINPNIGM